MKKRILLLSILVFLAVLIYSIYLYVKRGIEQIPKEAWLSPEQLCEQYNFPMERHYITTEDGYILTVLRIKPGNHDKSRNKKVVLLMHGLSATPMFFLANTPERASAFRLANAGYDVWLGSARGNVFARNHTTLNPDKDKEFWEFSWEQMGKYDLFAHIGYIKNFTGVEKIGYVGHSQGSLIMFYALSEFESKLKESVNAFAALAPVARAGNNKCPYVKYLNLLTPLHQYLGTMEFMTQNKVINGFTQFICSNWESACNAYLKFFTQQFPQNDEHRQAAIAFSYIPGGTSFKNQKHWDQMFKSGRFQLYDYGEGQNIRRYNQANPPEVDLTKIEDTTIGLFFAGGDFFTVGEDIKWLRSQLNPRVVDFDKTYEGFGHLSFGFGKDAGYTQDLINFLNKH